MYLKSPIPWVGGKGKLLPAIHALAPEGYSSFLDVFGGSGTVVLNHPHKKGVEEIYNDFNSDLTNLFECVKERTFSLLKELGFLPIHSRDEYEVILKFLRGEDFTAKYMEEELDLIDIFFVPLQAEELRRLKQERAGMYDVRRAAMYFRSIRESFCGTGKNFAGKSCNIRSFFHLIQAANRRIGDMVIENKDFAELYGQYGGPDTLAYFDPPYVDTEDMYPVDFGLADHYRLHELALSAQGYVMISYNDCPFIRELYKEFFIFRVLRPNSMSQKEGSEFAELIITNYDPRMFLASASPLEDAFNVYDNYETINMDVIHESIKDRAHTLIERQREDQRRILVRQ